MPFHNVVFIRCQLAGFIEDILPYANLADIVEQTGLLDDLHQIRLHASSFRQLGGVIGNVLRMAEGVMILGINGGGQGVDGAGVLVVSALIFDPPDLAAVDLRGIHQDRVFTRVLHHTHGGIRIIEQLSGRGGHVRRRADAGADCQTAEPLMRLLISPICAATFSVRHLAE